MKNNIKREIIKWAKKHHLALIIIRKIRLTFNRLKSFFFFFCKIDEHMVIFESYMGRQYSDSPKAIYLEMCEFYPNYKFVWVFKHPENYNLPKNTIKVKYGTKEYYKYYSKSKYWITNSRLNEALIKKNKQIYIQCWHGTPLKKLGFDITAPGGNAMNTLKDIRKKYQSDSKRYNYMISPSRYCSDIFKSAFNLSDKVKIKEIGYPRNDALFKYNKENISKIKKNLKIPKNKKVILYAPTWRDNEHVAGLGYTYSLEINFDLLKEKLEKEYIVLFRTHYFVANKIELKKYKGFVFDVSDYDNINDLYIISDLLITDYSSVFFDYANLKKPIIFYMYDYELYKNKLRDFYIDLDILPGPIIKNKNEKLLCKYIEESDSKFGKYIEKYNQFNNQFNYLDSKNSSKKLIEECIE